MFGALEESDVPEPFLWGLVPGPGRAGLQPAWGCFSLLRVILMAFSLFLTVALPATVQILDSTPNTSMIPIPCYQYPHPADNITLWGMNWWKGAELTQPTELSGGNTET